MDILPTSLVIIVYKKLEVLLFLSNPGNKDHIKVTKYEVERLIFFLFK